MDASSISSDNYGMEAMQAALAKKAQEADGQMALKLIQDTAQTNPGTLASGGSRVHVNAAGAVPSDRLGSNINIVA